MARKPLRTYSIAELQQQRMDAVGKPAGQYINSKVSAGGDPNDYVGMLYQTLKTFAPLAASYLPGDSGKVLLEKINDGAVSVVTVHYPRLKSLELAQRELGSTALEIVEPGVLFDEVVHSYEWSGTLIEAYAGSRISGAGADPTTHFLLLEPSRTFSARSTLELTVRRTDTR